LWIDAQFCQTVSLSLISDSWYFIEFADGATQFCLPPAWHESVNNFTELAMRSRGPKKSTSYNATPSPLHRSPPQPGQFEPFNPGNPFVANPHLMPALTGIPQQQAPVYPIINVNSNPIPQPRKASGMEKYNGVFKFLGGALTLAGTVLNVSSGGFGGF
jgi:hypothetical protein